jgi:uncharacterized protein involved in outer membrane biogenesis
MADRRLSRRLGIAAGVVIALIAGLWLAAAHATWARPLIQRYVSQHASRAIDFDRLELGLTGALEPSITFYGLKIENAPWAAKRPLVTAGLLSFTFSWKTLDSDKFVVQKLVLVDANVDLERKPDGLRNWRLGNPEDRGPGRVRVLAVDAQRSELRFLHEAIDLDVEMRMSPLVEPSSVDTQPSAVHANLPLTKRFSFAGKRNGKPFDGEADVSDMLSFSDTAAPFALRGEARSGDSRLKVDGFAVDIQQFGALDVQLELDSRRLSDLSVATPFAFPSSPTNFSATTHLTKRADLWSMAGLQAKLGNTDLHGDATVQDRRHASLPQGQTRPRPLLRATLASDAFHSADIVALLKPANPTKVAATKPPLDGSRLFALDADVDLQVGQIVLPPSASGKTFPVSGLRTHVALNDGQLAVAPVAFDVIGGHVSGEIRADAKAQPTALAADLKAVNLRAERLGKTLAGGIGGQLSLRAQGDTVDALVSSAAGTATLSLDKATIPKRLDARIALDGIAILGTMFGDADERVPVLCGVLALDVRGGRAVVRRMALETERVTVDGSGTAQFVPATIDVLLTPALKQSALLALDRSIHVSGPVSGPSIELTDPAPRRAAASGCASAKNPLTPVVAATRTSRDTGS